MMRSIFPLFISFITILFFQNCAPPFDVVHAKSPINKSTDPVFEPLILEFEALYGNSTSKVPIILDDLGEGVAGVCYRFALGSAVLWAYIKIDKNYWPRMSELQQKNLIFHELGHCVLMRGHVPFDSVRICPKSFMHDTVMSTQCLIDHMDEYVQEMFP